jgi:hypothetical protein
MVMATLTNALQLSGGNPVHWRGDAGDTHRAKSSLGTPGPKVKLSLLRSRLVNATSLFRDDGIVPVWQKHTSEIVFILMKGRALDTPIKQWDEWVILPEHTDTHCFSHASKTGDIYM